MTYESGNYIPQYNPDGSMTLFTVNGVEVKIMPMTRRNSRGGSIPVTNEFDALIAKYTDTVRENPQDFDACIMLAGLYFRRNRPGNSGEGIPADAELAVKYSNQALGLGINDPQALYLRGLAYANQGKNPQALTDFEVVLKSNLGTMKGVYYIMGMLFIRENRKDEAIEAFEKVQILDPDFGDTNTILEQLYSMR
jgi:tetratricopeptide (TPR) repeat protein